MATLNSVLLIGRLTRDPELRELAAGDGEVCSVMIEVVEKRGAEGPRRCSVLVEARGALARVCAAHLKADREIFVAGRLAAPCAGSKLARVTARAIQFLGVTPKDEPIEPTAAR